MFKNNQELLTILWCLKTSAEELSSKLAEIVLKLSEADESS